MTLQSVYNNGLTPDAFERLMTEEQRRLHALHARRAEIDEEAIEAVRSSGAELVLVITEPWCGDSLAVFPVVLRLFREAGCELRVVRRDEHPQLIDAFLTRGGRAIPIVLVLDDSYDVRLRWGPRPEPAQRVVEQHREGMTSGAVERALVYKEIRTFYASDAGRTIVAELVGGLRD